MNPDDPKFTAHALGEFEDLTAAERAEIEAILVSDPAAKSDAEETRTLAARLRAELTAEESGALHEEQRAAVFHAAVSDAAASKIVRFPFRRLAQIAAIFIVAGLAAYLLIPATEPARQQAMNSVPPSDSAKLSLEQKPDNLGGLLASNEPSPVPPIPVPPPSLPVSEPNLSAPQFAAGAAPADGVALAKPTAKTFTGALQPDGSTIASAPAASPAISEIQALTTAAQSPTPMLKAEHAAEPVPAAPMPTAAPAEKSLVANGSISSPVQSPPMTGTARGGAARFSVAGKDFDANQSNIGRVQTKSAPTAFPVTPTTPTQFEDNISQEGRSRGDLAWTRPVRAFSSLVETKKAGDERGLEIPDQQTGVAFDELAENAFLSVRANPLSTFSIDVDTASYPIVRRFLDENQRPPKGAVRIEELLNYFSYDYAQPEGEAPFSAAMEVASCPWAPDHRLVRIGLKGREIARDKRPASNLVFLIDVSGSMMPQNKLPLLKQSLGLLIDQLGPEDLVSMVVYAGRSGCVLEPTHDKRKMHAALGRLEAGGSTNGGSGVQLAYKIAEDSFIKGGTNRVILATDGDWNVGITNRSELINLIKREAKTGVFLTVLGVGMDNLNDRMLVKLADSGNGNYAYIDSLVEAKKVLVDQLSATLVTIAKDVKIQVEFNPAQVGAYRLVGYEKRMLAKQDFNDDKKDAGEIGAGHTVTALYEIVPAGQQLLAMQKAVDPLKYQPAAEPAPAAAAAPAKSTAAPAPEPTTAPAPVPAPAPGLPEVSHSQPQKAPSAAQPLRPDGGAEGALAKDVARPVPEGTLANKYEKLAEADKTKSDLSSDAVVHGAETQTAPRSAEKVAAKAKGDISAKKAADIRDELLTLKLRYKEPEAETSKLIEFPLTDRGTSWEQSSGDYRFAAAVAGYGMLLRDSPNKGDTTWSAVAEWAQEGKGKDASGYRMEFLSLIEKARAVSR